MFYKNWMSYIKDEAKITKIAMPGTHNSGTMGMSKLARCQNGTLFEQYQYGVRFFDIRLKADRKGRLFVGHGIMTGMPAQLAFESLKMILEQSEEFFVIKMMTYMNQQIGPFKLSYKGNKDETSRLIREYLSPEKYALTGYGDISSLTMGDIRKSGKKYIIINENKEYDFSNDCPVLGPWSSEVYGYKPEKFAKEIVSYLRNLDTDGFFWFQTQQTPNLGTENGWTKWPDDLDKLSRKYFPGIIAEIAADPKLVEKVNVVAGDFMTADYMKANEILSLNLNKGIVKDEMVEKYKRAIGK
ncbi:MAG: hypothetical protein IJE19_07730 [Clostridia bacterium]|nr:hypothetical protein [Clostridia bacterium]